MDLKKLPGYINSLTTVTSNAVCLLIPVIIALVSTEVILRYVFNSPTFWIWPVNKQLFGILVLFSGSYTMLHKSHIRIEMFYDHMKGRLKLIARLLYFLSFVLFVGVLIWQGALFGWDSFIVRERAVGGFRIPVYPLKLMIPVGAVLLLLQGLVVMLKGDD